MTDSVAEGRETALLLCHIASWSSMHALALADKFRADGVVSEFIVVSIDRPTADHDLANFVEIIEGDPSRRVVSTMVYASTIELFDKLKKFLKAHLAHHKKVERFYLPCNEFKNFQTPAISGLTELKGILDSKGVGFLAFDHGPGDWLALSDDNFSEALRVAKNINFSSDAVFDATSYADSKRLSVIDATHCLAAIRIVGEYVKFKTPELIDALNTQGDSLFIVGGTYDFSIGRSCFEEYLRIVREANERGIAVYFKPHKHYYVEQGGSVLRELREAGAIVIEAIACGAEVLIDLLRPIAVVGVCSSALRHSWLYLGIPAYTVVSPEVLKALLMSERSTAKSIMNLKHGSYRFLEIMMNACSLPYWGKSPSTLWDARSTAGYDGLLHELAAFTDLDRVVLPLREMVFSSYMSRLSRVKGVCDDFYLYTLDLCREKGYRFAVYGTGEGGRDMCRLAKNVGMRSLYFIDSKAHDAFASVFGVEVVELADLSSDRLGEIDAIVVSSVTYWEEIVGKLNPICEAAGVRIIHFGELVRR